MENQKVSLSGSNRENLNLVFLVRPELVVLIALLQSQHLIQKGCPNRLEATAKEASSLRETATMSRALIPLKAAITVGALETVARGSTALGTLVSKGPAPLSRNTYMTCHK